MRFIPFILLCAGLILVQCKSNLAQTKRTYDSLVTAKMGSGYQEKLSPAKTYSLVHANDTGKHSGDFKYAVIRLSGNEVVLEGRYNRGGYVRWLNDKMIEVLSIPAHVTSVKDSSLYKEQVYLEGITPP
jgi:hypothetical protein